MSWQLLATALLMISFSFVLYSTVASSLYGGVDVTLHSRAEAIVSGLDFQEGQANLPPEGIDFSTADLLIQVSDLTGKIIGRSANLGDKLLPLDASLRKRALALGTLGLFSTVTEGKDPPLRLLTVLAQGDGDPAPTMLVQVGASLAQVEAALGRLRFWLLIITPTLLVLFSLGSFFLADRLLRTLKAMAYTAEKIGERNITQRLPVANPHDEIGQLAGTFNRTFDRLQQAFENQRRFISDASHEMRTPLAVLQTKLEVTLRKERSPEEYRQVMESSLAQSKRLAKLVEHMLMLARADAGEWRPDLQPVRLDKLCAEAYAEIHPLAQQKRISLEASCADSLMVRGDPELLRHLILNLLDNAIKYTPEGGTVQMLLARQAQQARLTISDTGEGIPTEGLPRIFERFYRVDKGRSQRVAGTGLGLSIAKEVITAHRGTVQVESKSGQGTVFTVCLPICDTAPLPVNH